MVSSKQYYLGYLIQMIKIRYRIRILVKYGKNLIYETQNKEKLFICRTFHTLKTIL